MSAIRGRLSSGGSAPVPKAPVSAADCLVAVASLFIQSSISTLSSKISCARGSVMSVGISVSSLAPSAIVLPVAYRDLKLGLNPSRHFLRGAPDFF
jgi:hypothetical protein